MSQLMFKKLKGKHGDERLLVFKQGEITTPLCLFDNVELYALVSELDVDVVQEIVNNIRKRNQGEKG